MYIRKAGDDMSNMVIGKYKVVSKFRFTMFICVITIIICMCLSVINGSAIANGSSVAAYETVIVRPGDTLWDIADTYAKSDTDIRSFMHEIEEVNDVTGGNIYVGQELLIPV